MLKKHTGINIENYKELIDKSCYFVDKTLMIKDLPDYRVKVGLFTRPRRFGKTLTLSMIKTSLEIDLDDLKKDDTLYLDSLRFLSECLEKYHKTKVIILLDEHDVPLKNSFFEGFYKEMIDFVRSLFESTLKTNDCLQMAIVTGCLRISKESIFTGLNNLDIYSILSNNFADLFGFTQPEVEEMLCYYGFPEKIQEARDWYDGYLFGMTNVYNPWSIINYVREAASNPNAFPRPYWSNTSSNSIIRELVEKTDGLAKDNLEELIAGGTIEKTVHENVRKADFTPFYQAMRAQDTQKMEEFINNQLNFSISYHDEGERFYHGYLLGILGRMGGCKVLSNREQETGRSDIIIRPNNPHHPAFVIELKRVKSFPKQDASCDEALGQIKKRGYATELLHDGYEKVICYGICPFTAQLFLQKQIPYSSIFL